MSLRLIQLICVTSKSRVRYVGIGTFRAQDLWFPRTNRPYGELSFPGTKPRNFRSPGNFRSSDISFPGTFVPGNFHSGGTKSPENFHSLDLSFRGTFVPPTILQGISYEMQTAVTTVRICFVVGLVLLDFQK